MLLGMPSERSPIPSGLVQALVEIGRSEGFEELTRIRAAYPDEFNTCRFRTDWVAVAGLLDDESLVALIKSLTVAEGNRLGFIGGSVSPVIWTFRTLSRRSPHGYAPLVDWIRQHTDNQYLPFGSPRHHGARTWDEYEQLNRQYAAQRRQAEDTLRREAKSRRVAQATSRLFGALRRRDTKAVSALLAKGADIHTVNEHGQTAAQYARSLGLESLLAEQIDGTES